MNIFVPSNDPIECVKSLDDKRVVKMVLETTQILSTAAHIKGHKVTYKPTHQNHPSVKWAAENNDNYWWLYAYLCLLCVEYTIRYGKRHKCVSLLNELAVFIPCTGQTPFPNCTTNKEKGISFKHVEDVHEAYRLYLNARWKTDKIKPRWTNREKPSWADYEQD